MRKSISIVKKCIKKQPLTKNLANCIIHPYNILSPFSNDWFDRAYFKTAKCTRMVKGSVVFESKETVDTCFNTGYLMMALDQVTGAAHGSREIGNLTCPSVSMSLDVVVSKKQFLSLSENEIQSFYMLRVTSEEKMSSKDYLAADCKIYVENILIANGQHLRIKL